MSGAVSRGAAQDTLCSHTLESKMLEKMGQLQGDEEGLIQYLLGVVPVILAYYESGQPQEAAPPQEAKDRKRKRPDGRSSGGSGARKMTSVMDFFQGAAPPGAVQRAVSSEEPAAAAAPASKRGPIYRKFMEVQNTDGTADVEYVNDAFCSHCNRDRVMHEDEATLVCPGCGHAVNYIDTGISSIPFNASVDYNSFSYKRINHFNEWLAQFQGKEKTEIPQEVLDSIRREIKIARRTEVSQTAIKGILKKLRLNKYYEHVPAITNTLNGVPPPTMTPYQEATLRNCFRQIQHPFAEHCPPTRKNFLSYAYVLHKLCQLNGFDRFTQCFPLLKSREKLYEQDKIWKSICKALKWQFIASI